MRKPLMVIFIAICCAVLAVTAFAYTNNARNSLLKSRDQVADQRQQLERAYAEVDKKIDQLQQQKYEIGRYLTDCDKTLKDIDRAIDAQDSAFRGR